VGNNSFIFQQGLISMIFLRKPKITHADPDFDRVLALDMANLADQAYKDNNTIEFRNTEYSKISFYDEQTDTQSYLSKVSINIQGQQKDALVLGFRGTEDKIKDKLTDAKLLSSGYTYRKGIKGYFLRLLLPTRVHTGFLKAYRSIRDEIHDELRINDRFMNFDLILITGHSLGGSLATLAALDISHQYPDAELIMYNFGSPRVGNSRFAYHFDKRIINYWRVVHQGDVITQSPPKLGFLKHWLSYRHLRKSVTMEDGVQDKISTEYEDTQVITVEEFSKFVSEFLNREGDGWKKHSLSQYIPLLE
jgi:predicted lipase